MKNVAINEYKGPKEGEDNKQLDHYESNYSENFIEVENEQEKGNQDGPNEKDELRKSGRSFII